MLKKLLQGLLIGLAAAALALILYGLDALNGLENGTWDWRARLLKQASPATGQLIFLPVAAWIIEHHGWRFAVLPVFTATRLAMVPVDVGLTVRTIFAFAPFFMSPSAQMIRRVPRVRVHVPRSVLIVTNFVFLGTRSTRVTSSAVSGPRFVTAMS